MTINLCTALRQNQDEPVIGWFRPEFFGYAQESFVDSVRGELVEP
jgi:hypothetical protein